MTPFISIVSPLWNEVDNVLPLANQVFAAFARETRPLQLVLVDDASTDGTWERMLEARRADPRVLPVRHLKQSGQSAALWTGFHATNSEIIATLDGDLQNDPADFPKMLELLSEADMVCGARTKRMDNTVRRISSRIARGARKFVLGVDFRDTGCNLRVFKRSVLESVPPFNGFHRFMPILADGGGAIVREVPVAHRPRISGKSKYGVWNRLGRGVYDLFAIRWYRKRQLRRVPTAPAP